MWCCSMLCLHFLFKLNALFLVFPLINGSPEEPEITFEQLYQFGKDEYTAENWYNCVAFIRKAIEDFDYFVDENDWCREKCARMAADTNQQLQYAASENSDGEITEIVSMYSNAQRALCLFRCKAERFTTLRPPLEDPSIYEQFENRRPYYYLQYCYWKQRDLQSAVKSAFTYLVANPTDKDAIANIEFYMEQKGFTRSMLVDARQMKYEASYMKGVEAYNMEEWDQCVTNFDDSIEQFLEEEAKCRRICDDKLDWDTLEGVNPEITVILTSVYVSVLRCKNDCARKLSKVNGHNVVNILASCFEYLHLCQYNLNRGRDACQSVANSILLNPADPIMRRNRLFYSKKYGKEDLFEPSEKVVKFHRRDVIERTFLKFVDERFKYENSELPSERPEDRQPLRTDIWIGDDFDYTQLEKPLLSDAECAALIVAAASESMSVTQRQEIVELQERIAERYRTNPRLESLSCAHNKPQPKCDHHEIIIALDSDQCGAFLRALEPEGCSIMFCVP